MPFVLQLLRCLRQIHRHLRFEPKLGTALQHLGQKECRLGGDGTAPVDDAVLGGSAISWLSPFLSGGSR
jgi:hypothetical protein